MPLDRAACRRVLSSLREEDVAAALGRLGVSHWSAFLTFMADSISSTCSDLRLGEDEPAYMVFSAVCDWAGRERKHISER